MFNKILVFIGVFGFALASRTIPDYIHICHRSDPQLSKCIINSVEALKPQLKSGIRELDVPALDPLLIKQLTIFNGQDSAQFKLFLKDVKLYGASSFQIKNLKISEDLNTYIVRVKFGNITLNGDYDIDGKIVLVPIKGNGNFTFQAYEPNAEVTIVSNLIKNKGHREMKFSRFDIALKVKDYDIHLENLFGGDKILRQAIREVFLTNKEEILQQLLPTVQDNISALLKIIANKITEDLDYDKVYPK